MQMTPPMKHKKASPGKQPGRKGIDLDKRLKQKAARKANWKRKGYTAAQKSLSLAKSMLRGKRTSFVYSVYNDEND